MTFFFKKNQLPLSPAVWRKTEVSSVHEQSPGRMNNGVFGPWDACPKGAFAVGFRARFSPFHGAVHTPDKRNMGVAAIHLLCEDPPGKPMRWSPVYISSNEVRGEILFF